jgi:protein-disulfide isomerase
MASSQGGLGRFYVVFVVLAVVGFGGLAWIVFNRPGNVTIPADVQVVASDTAGFSGYYLGSEGAPVTITEYADYQCPACQTFELQQFGAIRRRLIETGKVRWRYRDFPLNIHSHARLAAHSAACAEEQGRYWEQHSALYEGQPEWAGSGNAGGMFRDYAKRIGLDLGQYDTCMESAKYAGRIEASLQEAVRVGANSTPTFIIGNTLVPGAVGSDRIEQMVNTIIAADTAP